MTSAKFLAIASSAYNVCGPRTGNAATPATVRSMVSRTEMARLLSLYAAHVAADKLALYTVADVDHARAMLG